MSSKCPCCSSSLLRHWKNDGIYWFCSHCRQEMPNFEAQEINKYHHHQEKKFEKSMIISTKFSTFNTSNQEIIIK